ncbi:MAG TPA: hypothetical protein VFY31_02080 [Macromonas sp.]|nr:hypothetical protein [Macromonas sp.]
MLVSVVAVLTSGCASFSVPSYTPDYPTLDQMKRENIEKISVGQFQPQDPNSPINKISLRGASLKPAEGNYAKYLEQAIRSDLADMRLLDPESPTRIEATLTQNYIDVSGISTGYGALEVELSVLKSGTAVFTKKYMVQTSFESSFAAAVAVPKGQNEYPNLVKTLLKNIYSDPDFLRSVKKSQGEKK